MPKRHLGPRKPHSQKKPPLTHFLCLPLVAASSRPQLEASIETFRENVSPNQQQQQQQQPSQTSTNPAITHIHPKAIRPVGVLHCTLGVMSLDKERLEKAIELLKNLDVEQLLSEAAAASPTSNSSPTNSPSNPTTESKIPASASPLKINLKGLSSMHSPQTTSILYIPPQTPPNASTPSA
jgi:activating signal cointegrator complex subunit 1